MSNNKPENVHPSKLSATVENKPVEHTHKSLAMFRDSTDTKYVLVEVSYTPGSGNVKELARDNREDVIDKFKMHAADYFMGDR